jgi:glucokinase
MDRLARALAALHRGTRLPEPLALGLALASPLDPATGTLHHPPNLPGWDGFSPQAYLAGRLGLPTWSHNDASLAALGEQTQGVGRGTASLVFISWGTGVGGGLVLDGRLYGGRRGFAGEVGHMVLVPQGTPCGCGSRGCLEQYVSGPAMARAARERIQAGEPSIVRRLVRGKLERIRSETLAQAERLGDPMARSVLAQAGAAMGTAIATIRHILDPDLIVIGGGVAAMLHALYPALVRSAKAHSMGSDVGFFPVASTALGDDAGLLGAAVLAWQGLSGP